MPVRLRLPRSLGSFLAVAAPFVLAVVSFVLPAPVSAAPNGKEKKTEKSSKKKATKEASKKLPPLPAKTDDAPDVKTVAETPAPVAKKKVEEPEEPPVELTGALPEAKLANKKPKPKKADDAKSDKDAKKVVASKDKPEIEKKDAKTGKSDKSDGKKKNVKGTITVVDDGIPWKGIDPHKPGLAKEPTPEFGGVESDPDKKPKVKTCLNPAVTFARLGQPTDVAFALTTCKGKIAPLAIEYLSILGRPYDLPQPAWMKAEQVLNLPAQQISAEVQKTFEAKKSSIKPSKLGVKTDPKEDGSDKEVAPGIKRLDNGLVLRLQAIADKFPGKTITLVSGYRPKSNGSPHKAGHAFDIRLDGVTNETLVAFCKTLKDTGCGYYPNSYFVHVDVREPGTGHVFWIDVSGPGEKPQYVKSWPPPALPKSKPAKPNEATTPQVDEATGEPIDPTVDTTTIGPMDEVTEP